ncbi:MAG: MBL fold metallo-hydrolase [Candidatus Freyarchaeota archaeon]|nr:MBL fold metallo-hydrolase [Candidatus Freyrarchaeum guaymaensis]
MNDHGSRVKEPSNLPSSHASRGIRFKLVWFDSFGAKSSCVLVETDDVTVLIDPGVAVMHPSFPASSVEKALWAAKGRRAIVNAARRADVIVVSHYHWDHFTRDPDVYRNKLLLAKNPNEYINDSQRKRAVEFYSNLWKTFGGKTIEFKPRRDVRFKDPADELSSISMNFGGYQERRLELLEAGRKWFKRRAEKWRSYKVIPEAELRGLKIVYPEGRELRFGGTKLRFSPPLFHGIEYSRVGWVFSTVIEFKGEKLLHSSDLNGPVIEDYAEMIVRENPSYIILDGPMTYMLGYTLNMVNFRRVLENAKRIVEEADFKLMIWDHHLPREPRFRERTRSVWTAAERKGKPLMTASEFQLGKKPVVERTL